MKQIIRIIFLIFIVILATSLIGCKGGADVEEEEVDEKVAALDTLLCMIQAPGGEVVQIKKKVK